MARISNAGRNAAMKDLEQAANDRVAEAAEASSAAGEAESAAPSVEPAEPSVLETNAGVHEELHEAVISSIERSAENFMAHHGSVGDRLRDTMIDIFKTRPKPWSQMSSGEQKDMAKAIESSVKSALRMAVVELAAEDRPYIRGKLEKHGNDGGKIKGNLTFFSVGDPELLALHHATGKEVVLIMADADEATRAMREAPIEPDQNDFGFADDQLPEPTKAIEDQSEAEAVEHDNTEDAED